jgi:hypothetical protein
MSKFLILLLVAFLTSCSVEKPDCSECEKKLESILKNMTTPLDLPEEKADSDRPKENQLTAIILQNNKYQFTDDETEYSFDDYIDVLKERKNE